MDLGYGIIIFTDFGVAWWYSVGNGERFSVVVGVFVLRDDKCPDCTADLAVFGDFS